MNLCGNYAYIIISMIELIPYNNCDIFNLISIKNHNNKY